MNLKRLKLKLKWWWKYTRPFISRKEHQRSLLDQLASIHRSADVELQKKEKILDDLLPKLMRISLERSESHYGTFRCMVDFDTQFVYNAFIHGDSQEQIRYVATHLSRLIESELLTINFARFNSYSPRPLQPVSADDYSPSSR